MSDEIVARIDAEDFFSKVAELETFAKSKDFDGVLTQWAGVVVKDVVSITPPHMNYERPGSLVARRRTEAKIDRDLYAIFDPVILKGRRPEQIIDLNYVWNRHMAKKNWNSRKAVQRDRPEPYFVSIERFEILRKEIKGHVGRLASGWLASWNALRQGAAPAWISRHGTSRGNYSFQFSNTFKSIVMENKGEQIGNISDLVRRVEHAFGRTLRSMEKTLAKAAESRMRRAA